MKQTSITKNVLPMLAARLAKTAVSLPIAAMVMATLLSAHRADASPYASCLTNNAGVISFRLNEAAQFVSITFTNVASVTVTTNLGAKSAGLTVTNLVSVPGNFTVNVTNLSAPGYVSGLPIQISNDQTNNTITTGGIITNTLRFSNPRSVAVNLNPASPSFGRIYVANSIPGAPTAAATRTLGDGIYILNADYSDTYGQGTNARNAGFTAFTNAVTGSTDDGNTPWRLEIGEDNNLYIADFSSNNGCIFQTDPSVTTGINVLVGFGIAGAPNSSPSANHGRIGSSVIAKGSTNTGNLVLYALDTDATATSDGVGNHIMKWDIGAGPLPVDLTAGTVVSNMDNATLLPNPGINEDLAQGPDGKFYLSQNRSVGNEGGVFVVDPASDGLSAFNPVADNLWDEVYDSRADSIGNYGATVDILLQTRGIKVSPDGKYLAVVRDDNQVWIIQLTNGIPDLSTRKLMVNTGTTTLGRDISFDAANNLYVLSSGQQVLRVFSPGYRTIAQTSSKGTFVFTNVLPANTVSVTATDANAAEPGGLAGDTGTFTFSRIGDTSQPLTVNYTISGTATRGVDYVTNGAAGAIPVINGTIAFAAGDSTTNVTIDVIDDSLGEATETVTFTLVATTNFISGGTTAATVSIADDGDLPQVSIATRGLGSYELIPYRPGKFTLSIAAVAAADVNVVCALTGTAVAGIDYTNTALITNTIPQGLTNIIATVTPIDNSSIAPDKTIIITVVTNGNTYSTNNAAYSVTNSLRNDDLLAGSTAFSENFDSDHTANWLVKVNTNDYVCDFFFDYSTVGIPSAPHTSGGTTRGLKMKAHTANVSGTVFGVSVSPLGVGFTNDYRLRFDAWYNFNGPLDGTGTGSTELLYAGVGGSTTRTNGPFGVPAGFNVAFGYDAEGGQGAGAGFRDFDAITNQAFLDPSITSLNVWPAGTTSAARDNANAYYAEFGDLTAPAAQISVFPNQIRTNGVGTMGMTWHDVIITKTSTNVTWTVDGLLMCTVITTSFNSLMSTNIFFGTTDPNTGSLADNQNALFGLIDNVKVEQLINTNALLSSLSISPGALNPTFDPGTTNYTPTGFFVGGSAETITATSPNPYATMKLSFNGGSFIPLTNGVASLPQTLNQGPFTNTMLVRVTAEDGTTINNYTVNLKVASTNALLSSLAVSSTTYSPSFSPGTTTYAATNSFVNNPVAVTATSADPNATLQLSLNGGAFGPLTNSTASLLQTLNLNPPTNTLVVKVISQDANNTNNYSVKVKLLPSQTVPILTNSLSGSVLTFTWASDHVGYRLQSQTNDLSVGLGATWFPVPNSDVTNKVNATVDSANPTVFYRLIYP
jgi:hypothetical protein